MRHAIVAVLVLSLAVSAVAQPAVAQSSDEPAESAAWAVLPLASIQFTDGEAAPHLGPSPWAAIDGAGEAWVAPNDFDGFVDYRTGDFGVGTLAVQVPEAREVTGKLFTGKGDPPRPFRIPAPGFASDPPTRGRFLRVERDVANQRLNAGDAGAAWWRHRVAELSRQLQEPVPPAPRGWRSDPSNLDDTFSLFSGGRAVAENLQLDRLLPATPDPKDDEYQDIAGIPGIEVAGYDWSALLAGKTPALDPLASLIPEDQHALFFPSFTALTAMADKLDAEGTAVLSAIAEPAEEAGTRGRCERQLGLPMSELARLLGPQLIDSVAFTGGDPYLRSGSDVAVLFETKQAAALLALVRARVASATAAAGVESRSGTTDGVEWTGRVSADRAVSSYVARLGDVVVVSNSEVQLARLVATLHGATPPLAAAPEYAFFRDRYPRGDAQETALLVLSDATIRRWCGPRWRIGASRRVRAEAELAELQAAAVDDVARGAPGSEAGPVANPPQGLGEVLRTPEGVRSSVYGTLGFLTPVAELDLDRVSESEAALYGRWRDGYQSNWSGAFDPIAVRFGVQPGGLTLDLTVRPLITRSDFSEFVELTRGAEIAPQACDPHPEALVQVVMAINPKSSFLRENTSMLALMAPGLDAFGWLGSSVSWYADDDPFWSEWLAAEDSDDFVESRHFQIPLGLHAEVRDPMLLTAALLALHGLADVAAPGMTEWENASYRDEPFVIIKPSARALADGDVPDGVSFRYSPSGRGLVLTPDPRLMERALERRIARREPTTASQPDWPGKSLCVRIDGKALPLLADVFDRFWRSTRGENPLRAESFANLPILNEWHRLFPDADPLATHERLWHRRLTCPGGGEYRWNAEWQTMESTVFGHPGAPLDGPRLPPGLLKLRWAQAGLSFEENGLRARVDLVDDAR